MADWISFWNGDHPIYVNARHKAVHYARISADIARLLPGPQARVLDYGCGDTLGAADLAARCGHLALADAAPAVRARLAARLAGEAKVAVLSPEEVEALPGGSFDLIVCNSVSQYLSRETLAGLLQLWHRLLAPGGTLLVADVIPPQVNAMVDARVLLTLAVREGFLIGAVTGLVRTCFSSYRKLRHEVGLTTYEEPQMLALLQAAGFQARRTRPNVGYNQQRMAFLAIR